MKKFLVLWFMVLFMVGCYEPGEETVTGVFEVTSDSAVTITYEAIDGDDVVIESAGGVSTYYFSFRAKEEDGIDPYWINVRVISNAGSQNIYMTLSIDGDAGVFVKDARDVTEVAFRAFYCPSWSTQCATVNTGVR